MAPELLRDQSVNTAASDVYSFGIILYEVYSRRDPYEGEDPTEVVASVMDEHVRKRPPIPSNCPPAIQTIMAECIRNDAWKRPAFEELDIRLKREEVDSVDPGQPTTGKASQISLFDIFPRHIAEAMRDGRAVEPEHRDVVTIFFSDIVGFTNISSELPPRKVANMLDRLYTKLDSLSQEYDVFKVETIGDAYMAVTNLVKDQSEDHAKRIAEFAIKAVQAANETCVDEDDPKRGFVNLRVGFHSGSVVADVVGTRNPRYCLFGDTVNTASRMESSSKANRIHCSRNAADILLEQCQKIPLKSRGVIPIKGKGDMHTFWVNEKGVKRPKLGKLLSGAEQSMLKWAETGTSAGRKLMLETNEETPDGSEENGGDVEMPLQDVVVPLNDDSKGGMQ
jgi:class 3 adenylate cyclase